jgi:hypothetical protein
MRTGSMSTSTDRYYYRQPPKSQDPAPLRREVVNMVTGPITNSAPSTGGFKVEKPGIRHYNRRGGRPGLDIDFEAVCDAVLGARNGSGETMTDIAARFGVSRGWLHKWVYPALMADAPKRLGKVERGGPNP